MPLELKILPSFDFALDFAGRVRRCCGHGLTPKYLQRPWAGNASLMVRGFGGKGQTSGRVVRAGRIAKDTLLFGRLGLANMRQETRKWCAALKPVHLAETGQFLAP